MKTCYLGFLSLQFLAGVSLSFATFTDTLPPQAKPWGCNTRDIICSIEGDKSKLCQVKFWDDKILDEPIDVPPGDHTVRAPGVNYDAPYRYVVKGKTFRSFCLSSGEVANKIKKAVRAQLGLLPSRNDRCNEDKLPCIFKRNKCKVLFFGNNSLKQPITTHDTPLPENDAQTLSFKGKAYQYRCWSPSTIFDETTTTDIPITPIEVKRMLKEKLGIAVAEDPASEIPAPIENHLCGPASVACTIKDNECIFNISGQIKTVAKNTKGILTSPKYQKDDISYGCMRREEFDALDN